MKKIFINGQWKLLTPLNITDKEVRMDTVLHALYFFWRFRPKLMLTYGIQEHMYIKYTTVLGGFGWVVGGFGWVLDGFWLV